MHREKWVGGRCGLMSLKLGISTENWMGPYQRTPKQVAWAIRYSAGPVGDFLDATELSAKRYRAFAPLCYLGSFNETAHDSQMLSGTKQMNIQQICGWRFSTSLDFGSFRDLWAMNIRKGLIIKVRACHSCNCTLLSFPNLWKEEGKNKEETQKHRYNHKTFPPTIL